MINKETTKHYLWGNNCHGWHLVKQLELSDLKFLVISHPSHGDRILSDSIESSPS